MNHELGSCRTPAVSSGPEGELRAQVGAYVDASGARRDDSGADSCEEAKLVAFVNGRIKLGASVLGVGALTFFFIPGFLKVAGLAILALVIVVANKLDSTI